MQPVDSRDVDLDDPAVDYVTELRLATAQPVATISLRAVLQQTSGLSDLRGGPMLASAADDTTLDAVAELEDAELVSTPGETWRYANANYVLAGLVVERASGMSYGDYVQQVIPTPPGMTHGSATTDPPAATCWPTVTGSGSGSPSPRTRPGERPPSRLDYLISTAEDLTWGRYLSLHPADGVGPDGTRIVSAAGLQTTLTAGPEAHLGTWAQGRESATRGRPGCSPPGPPPDRPPDLPTPPPPKGSMTTYPLEIGHVTKRYGHDVVVDDLAFTVTPDGSPDSWGPTALASRRP